MAEERLIDDDKDKKYKIKLNADGEEELVIDESAEELQAEVEEVTFDAPEDDVDENGLTPEQLAAEREREEKERAERQARVEELIDKAKADCSHFKYATALEYLEEAEEIDGENGEIHALKLRAYTRDFSDYSQIVPAAEGAENIAKYSTDEQRQKLLTAAGASLDDNIAKLRNKVEAMRRENDEKKATRAVKFKRDRNAALIAFCCIFAFFAVCAGLAIGFATIIYTVSTGVYLILTCVFGGLALIALIALAFAARQLNITSRRIRMNKRNTSTQLGRDLLAEQAKLRAFIDVNNALKGKK